MRIGLQVPDFDWPGSPANMGETLAEIATVADRAGFYSLWVMDHFFQLGEEDGSGPVDSAMLEGYSTIAYLAAITRRIKVGVLVTGNPYRHPGILVKTITTLDVLSGGRAYFGIGAGWYEREALGLGVPWPPLQERFERLEETLQIAKSMWHGDVKPYKGKHYQLAEPINSPQPLSRPHPPILIGGGGERKTLRLVAQYADACNLWLGGPGGHQSGVQRARSKLDILRQHCSDVGRRYDDIERTTLAHINLSPGAQSTDAIISLCRQLAEIGVQHAIFNLPNTHEIRPLELIGSEIIPVVAEF